MQIVGSAQASEEGKVFHKTIGDRVFSCRDFTTIAYLKRARRAIQRKDLSAKMGVWIMLQRQPLDVSTMILSANALSTLRWFQGVDDEPYQYLYRVDEPQRAIEHINQLWGVNVTLIEKDNITQIHGLNPIIPEGDLNIQTGVSYLLIRSILRGHRDVRQGVLQHLKITIPLVISARTYEDVISEVVRYLSEYGMMIQYDLIQSDDLLTCQLSIGDEEMLRVLRDLHKPLASWDDISTTNRTARMRQEAINYARESGLNSVVDTLEQAGVCKWGVCK